MHYSNVNKVPTITLTNSKIPEAIVKRHPNYPAILNYANNVTRFIDLWDITFPLYISNCIRPKHRVIPDKGLYIVTVDNLLDDILLEEFGMSKSVKDFLLAYPFTQEHIVLNSEGNVPLQYIERIVYEEGMTVPEYGTSLLTYIYKPIRLYLNQILYKLLANSPTGVTALSYAPCAMIIQTNDDKERILNIIKEYNAELRGVGTVESIDWYLKTFR